MSTEKNIQLTNEQIVRVFAMSLPFKAQWKDPDGDIDDCRVNGIVKDVWKGTWMCKTMWNGIEVIQPVENFKPYYTPLSAITDEDAIEVAKILKSPHATYHLSDEKNMIESTKYWIEHGLIAVFSSNGMQNHFAFQYLIQKGYAVPLFIAPNHPANGKTAIELGLAIDSITYKA